MLYVGSGEAEVGGGSGAEADAEPPLAAAGSPWAGRAVPMLPPFPTMNSRKLSWLIPLRNTELQRRMLPTKLNCCAKAYKRRAILNKNTALANGWQIIILLIIIYYP